MDQAGLDSDVHAVALSGLSRINWWSRSRAVMWQAIEAEVNTDPGRTWKVLDIASGAGDIACGIARRAAARELKLKVLGCDISPTAVAQARQRASRLNVQGQVAFEVLDVLTQPLPSDYDIITCSLFLHHLEEHEALLLLRKMAAAGTLVLLSDLRRTRLGYLMAWAGTRILSRSAIVRFDGPISVEGAFTTDEVLRLAQQAEMDGATITSHWPQRFLLRWKRGSPC
jgi:2-polyprenyl-3-methyl-5-hydroxy-6-metoxy-1,4-benzoquinol methylase